MILNKEMEFIIIKSLDLHPSGYTGGHCEDFIHLFLFHQIVKHLLDRDGAFGSTLLKKTMVGFLDRPNDAVCSH